MRDHFRCVSFHKKRLLQERRCGKVRLCRHNIFWVAGHFCLCHLPCISIPEFMEVLVLHETSSRFIRVKVLKLRYYRPFSDLISYKRDHTAGPAPILIRYDLKGPFLLSIFLYCLAALKLNWLLQKYRYPSMMAALSACWMRPLLTSVLTT